MVDKTEEYARALVALSGNALLHDIRKDFLINMPAGVLDMIVERIQISSADDRDSHIRALSVLHGNTLLHQLRKEFWAKVPDSVLDTIVARFENQNLAKAGTLASPTTLPDSQLVPQQAISGFSPQARTAKQPTAFQCKLSILKIRAVLMCS